MTDLISTVIRELEQRKAALEKALEALGEIESPDATASGPVSTRKKGKKRSAATRKRMRDAQRARWESIRAEAGKVPF